MFAYIYNIYAYVCLYISEMNNCMILGIREKY